MLALIKFLGGKVTHSVVCLHVYCMCVFACALHAHLNVWPLQYAFRDEHFHGKVMPLLFNSVNREICNGFHDLLGGTQWFICGSGGID